MVSNNRGNEEYPSSSSFRLQRHDECPLTFAQNEAEGVFNNGSWAGADPVSTNMPLSGASYFWRNMHVNHQPYTHVIPETVGSLAGLDNSIGSQYPRTEPNYLNGGSNFASRPVPDVACLEGNNKEVSPSQICDNIVAADNMVNGVTHFSGFLNPQVNRNFTLNGRRGVHPVTMKGGEVNRNHIYGSQDPKYFVSLGGSTPKFHHSQISGGTNNVDVEAHPIGSGKIDRNFLTLGVGGPANASLKFDPITEDISNNLVKAVSLQSNTSHFQSGHRSSSPLVQNSARGFQPIRNIGGCSNLTDDAAGMTSANNNLGVTGGNDAYLSSSSFHYVQKPQVERQHDLPRPSSIRNLGIIGNMDSRYANINLYDRFQGNNAASSGPFASSSARFIDARQSGFPVLSSESAKLPSLPTQPTDQPESCHAKPFQNFSSESSMVSPLVGPRGSFLREGRSARLSSAHRGGGLFSKRPGIHVNDIRAAQVAQHRSYPSQVGVQPGGKGIFFIS